MSLKNNRLNNVLSIYLSIDIYIYSAFPKQCSKRFTITINVCIHFICSRSLLFDDGACKRKQYCPALAEGGRWHTIQIWVIYSFILYLMCSSSRPDFMHGHSSCWEICWVGHHSVPLASVEVADAFYSFTRNVTFVTCFLLQSGAEYPVTFFYITKIYIIIIGFQPIDSFWYVVKMKLNDFSLLSHNCVVSVWISWCPVGFFYQKWSNFQGMT